MDTIFTDYWKLFNKADTNKDGYLTRQEVQNILSDHEAHADHSENTGDNT